MRNYTRYGYAILAVPLAILLRFALVPLIGYGIPYIMLFPVTVGVALLAGLGPAVLTGVLGSIVTDYFFIPPLHTIIFDIPHITRGAVMVSTSIFVGYVGDRLRTARAKAEKQALALQQSEERLKRSQEIAHLGSWELDLVNNNLTWSDEVYRIFGLQPREFSATYEAFLERVHPDDRDAVNEAYSRSLREGRDTYEIEHRVVRKDTGEIRHVHEKCQHFRDETGGIIRSVGMVHDITERKKAEEKVIRAKEEWERTFDSVPDLIAILDPQFRIIRVNRAMASKLGATTEECVGLLCHNCVHGLSEAPVFCPHSLTVADGKQHTSEVHEDKLGGDFLVTTTPLFDEHGLMVGSVHVARDITEQKKAEKEIKSLNDDLKHHVVELEAVNKELEAFSYSVSHDLRSPLRSIVGFGQVLLEDYADKLDEDGRDALGRMIAATQRMGRLIDDLLNLSRISRNEMTPRTVNLSEIAREISTELSAAEPDRKVEFLIAEGVIVRGDGTLLRLVLTNLLENAWKFTGKSAQAKIEFGQLRNAECEMRNEPTPAPLPRGDSEFENSEIVYYVRDNGAGFDMAYADKLGMPFQRLHAMNEFPGSGVGLATVQRIIHRHGGLFWMEGEVGKGATAYFTLG